MQEQKCFALIQSERGLNELNRGADLLSIKDCVQNELFEVWGSAKPLAKLIATPKGRYFYDAGTNRIFSCTLLEAELLKNLLDLSLQEALDFHRYQSSAEEFIDALTTIRSLMKSQDILKATRIKLLIPNNYESVFQDSLGQIILEVTEECNLRCRYCIYDPSFSQKRNHGNKEMAFDTAVQAIDYLAGHSGRKDKVGISFYGGEPLLRFPFIKECVRYAKGKIPEQKLFFSMTTNGTLIDRDISAFLSKNEFAVHVSIDGPQEIHDENRISRAGIGSFMEAKRGLDLLLGAYDDNIKNRINLSMVYSPPYSEQRLARIAALWDDGSLPRNIGITFSYAQKGVPPTGLNIDRLDYSLLNWTIRNYLESYRAGQKPHPLAAQTLDLKLAAIHRRDVHQGQVQETGLNSCCFPGVRKIYVSTNGTAYLCERVGLSPDLGDIRCGLDIDKIMKAFLLDYRDMSSTVCSGCWCFRLCDICYVHSFYNGCLNRNYKQYHCQIQRKVHEIYLKLYCTLMEINPAGLDHLLQMKIT
ncbi:MAG: radical SAM protein [Acidobacteria bacterium]|jgi:uncharacterized protein|nr:radical SAM protein [Acidobacteriota bacterium]